MIHVECITQSVISAATHASLQADITILHYYNLVTISIQ